MSPFVFLPKTICRVFRIPRGPEGVSWHLDSTRQFLFQEGQTMPGRKKTSLLGSKDVAWILDCSPDDVIELARKEKLKATKQGRFWRFQETDVLAYKKRLARTGG